MATRPCPSCGATLDTRTCCRFEDDSTGRELLLCSTCCPNCFGGKGIPNPNTPTTTQETRH